jgi:hypothetical protein
MTKRVRHLGGWLALPMCFCGVLRADAPPVQVRVVFNEELGPMLMERMALGQGGLSEEPMFADRLTEIRALKPGIIRLFVQEYYNLLPERGQYHFTAAILRADPDARIGGPALASVQSPILPALLDACATKHIPLHFVSWHLYSSSPAAIRSTIDYVHGLLKKHPELRPETFIDEWNVDLFNPPPDRRYQPCYVAETIWQMKDVGLDWSCYYHIRDCYVSYETFSKYFSANGSAFMTRWWNRQSQFDGLFDYQNQVRPAYFAFKLLSRMAGERLRVRSTSDRVHGFATHDLQLQMHNVMLWNFSREPAHVDMSLEALPKEMRARHITLDAADPGVEENQRLRPEPLQALKAGDQKLSLKLEPWAIHYWSLE